MQATRILAIRHGETDWNVATRIQGHIDIALNATGLQQAHSVAQALAEREPLQAVYSSDLSRALVTAQTIAKAQGLVVGTHLGLRERHFGAFQGRTFAEVELATPELARHWRQRSPDWSPPEGGESLIVLRERVLKAVDELAARHLGEHIVLVAHGGVLDVLYRAATHLDLQAPRSWSLPNTAVNRLLWTPEGLSLVGWADTSHWECVARDESPER